MGPTVCDDDGPIPMENKSNIEMTACSVVDASSSGSCPEKCACEKDDVSFSLSSRTVEYIRRGVMATMGVRERAINNRGAARTHRPTIPATGIRNLKGWVSAPSP